MKRSDLESLSYDQLVAEIKRSQGRLHELGAAQAERSFSDDERNEWNDENEGIDIARALLAEKQAVKERMEELADDENRSVPAVPSIPQTKRPGSVREEDVFDLSTFRPSAADPERAAGEFRDRARRAIDSVRAFPHPGADTDSTKEHLERMVTGRHGSDASRHIILTGSPLYERAWVKQMGKQILSPDEQRALNLTGSTGGYLLPYTLDPTIIPVTDGAINPVRSLARNVQTTTNVWKGVSSEGMTAAYREAEAEETTDDSPSVAQPEITCHAADAFAQWTYEFGQDFGSISPELARMVQMAKDKLEATKLVSGSGEKEPFGVLTGAEEAVETATEKVFVSADITTLEEGLGDYYTSNATFLGHRGIYNKISGFESEGSGPLWQTLNSLQVGAGHTTDGRVPRLLLEYPAYRSSTMQSTVTQNKYILLFGDFNYYVVADRIGMLAKPIDNIPGEEGRPTGQEGLYFFWRNGAKVMSKKAFRKLKVK